MAEMRRRSSTEEIVGVKHNRQLEDPVPPERPISALLDDQCAKETNSSRKYQSMVDLTRFRCDREDVGTMSGSEPNLGKIRELEQDSHDVASAWNVGSAPENPEKLNQQVDDGVIGAELGKITSKVDGDERKTFNESRTALCSSSNRLVKLAELSHQVNDYPYAPIDSTYFWSFLSH